MSDAKPGLYLAKILDKNWGLHLHNLPDLYLKFRQLAHQHNEASGGRLSIFYQCDSAMNFDLICEDRFFRYYERNDDFWKRFPNYHYDEIFEYLFVEFWCGDHDLILEHSMKIAEELGVELKTEGWR